jgi:hypothetical protein
VSSRLDHQFVEVAMGDGRDDYTVEQDLERTQSKLKSAPRQMRVLPSP